MLSKIYGFYIDLKFKCAMWQFRRMILKSDLADELTHQRIRLMFWKMKRILDAEGIDTKDIFKDVL